MRLGALLLLALSVGGCGGPVSDAKRAAAALLKDPASAQFREVRQGGSLVCGEINGRNTYGAYSGFTRFVYDGLGAQIEPVNGRLGASASDTMRLTELMNKAFQSSGSSTQEAASAALQLSQALASGLLQGDELRSLRENAPLLAKAIADAMGVSIGALKELGAEGKITSSVVMKAILAAGDSIEARFGATTMTVSQAMTVLNNEIGKYIGQADAGLSATDRMAQAIVTLAQNLDTVTDVVTVAATVIGTTLASRAIGAGIVSLRHRPPRSGR